MKLSKVQGLSLRLSRPFTGAWIETYPAPKPITVIIRRPFTGAWIETPQAADDNSPGRVAPSRGRGLKLLGRQTLKRAQRSPLHGGVD